jgi:hypothetical protein
MDKDTSKESGSVTGDEKYQLRIEPTANPGEPHKLPLWYLWPVPIPLFFWMAMPHYREAWFTCAAILLFVACWAMLRKERSIDTTDVDRELVLYLLTAVSGGFAVACGVFVMFTVAWPL